MDLGCSNVSRNRSRFYSRVPSSRGVLSFLSSRRALNSRAALSSSGSLNFRGALNPRGALSSRGVLRSRGALSFRGAPRKFGECVVGVQRLNFVGDDSIISCCLILCLRIDYFQVKTCILRDLLMQLLCRARLAYRLHISLEWQWCC